MWIKCHLHEWLISVFHSRWELVYAPSTYSRACPRKDSVYPCQREDFSSLQKGPGKGAGLGRAWSRGGFGRRMVWGLAEQLIQGLEPSQGISAHLPRCWTSATTSCPLCLPTCPRPLRSCTCRTTASAMWAPKPSSAHPACVPSSSGAFRQLGRSTWAGEGHGGLWGPQ